MTLEEQIEAGLKFWGANLAFDLKKSLEQALKDAGSKNPQEASLNFYADVKQQGSDVSVKIYATGDYWINIEEGRKPNSKMPPPDKLGKKWMNKNNIDPRKILADIELKRKNGLSKTNRRMTRQKKKLSFDEAAKRLSFVFARSIGKKGIEAKPFVDRVINQEAIDNLNNIMADIIGKEITASINLNNEFRNINIIT